MIDNDLSVKNNQLSLKLIFLGNQGVGKSAILNRFANDKFDEGYQATIGLDYHSRVVNINNNTVKLILYDTAGQEKFKSLLKLYVRNANIIMAVYDITCKDSFVKLGEWISDSIDNSINKHNIENNNKNDDNPIVIIIGNKTDKEDMRKVMFKEGETYSKTNNYLFVETSAKTGDGIYSMFNDILYNEIAKKYNLNEISKNNNNDKNILNKIKDNNKNEDLCSNKNKCC